MVWNKHFTKAQLVKGVNNGRKKELKALWKRYNKRGIGVAMFHKIAGNQGFTKQEQNTIIKEIGFKED